MRHLGEAPRRRGYPPWVRVSLWTAAILLVAATLIPLVESDWWWVRVLMFPQLQFALLLLVLAVVIVLLFGIGRGTPWGLLGVIAAALAYQLHTLLPYTPFWPVEAPSARHCPAADPLRVLVVNVREANEDAAPVIALLREVDPDLFLALETDGYWDRAFDPLAAALPHSVTAPRDSPWGMALHSRLPLVEPAVRHLVEDGVPSIKARVRLRSGRAVDFYGLHPKPPLGRSSRKGDDEVIRAAREIGRGGRPAILAGDLNDVPWGHAAQKMKRAGSLRDPRVGRGFAATFDADNPLMRWPIDHVYVTGDFGIVRFEPLRDVGADHFPLLAELCLPPEAAR